MFENVDIHTIHIWTTEAYLYYKLTNEPKGSGELKKSFPYSQMLNVKAKKNALFPETSQYFLGSVDRQKKILYRKNMKIIKIP